MCQPLISDFPKSLLRPEALWVLCGNEIFTTKKERKRILTFFIVFRARKGRRYTGLSKKDEVFFGRGEIDVKANIRQKSVGY